ncbi:hypothetical protein [Micromonospora chersina]|uniref:hypothetical protein n=1 Tax=Micromonospora chersina TaxID=47854 RepID=UPI0033C25D3E
MSAEFVGVAETPRAARWSSPMPLGRGMHFLQVETPTKLIAKLALLVAHTPTLSRIGWPPGGTYMMTETPTRQMTARMMS